MIYLMIILVSVVVMAIFALIYTLGIQEGRKRREIQQSNPTKYTFEYVPSMGLSKSKSYEQVKKGMTIHK